MSGAELKLRVPEDVRADVERVARERGTSMNAEIIRRLRATISDDVHAEQLRLLRDLYRHYMPPPQAVEAETGED